ncbi:MAG: arylsulfatase [Bacteroidia bacterium]|nr:arylsulfatase [Bacteroidia bacterium]
MKNIPYFSRLIYLAAIFIPTNIVAQISTQQKPPSSNPNIIFILADDIGHGDLSCYGAKSVRTPAVDSLAKRGILFTHAYSCASTCTPSRYGLLTGHYPWRLKNTGIARGDAPMIIKPGQSTVASFLKYSGYTTGVVGKWQLGLGEGGFNKQAWNDSITPGPKQAGFDYSFIMAASGDRVPTVFIENQRIVGLSKNDPIQLDYPNPFKDEPTGKANPELLKLVPDESHDQAILNGISRIGYQKGGRSALWVDENIADTITTKAVRFIEKNKNHPFFLYFCTNDIHVPRVPHPRFIGQTTMGARGDAIVEFDWSVSQIMGVLKRLGLENNTLIIISSDNGPVVEEGYKDQSHEKLGKHTPGGPLTGGKYSAFEAGTRVPFLVSWPGKVNPGSSNAIICQIDLMATLSALINRSLPAGSAPDSYNELNVWLGNSTRNRDFIVEQSIGTLSVIERFYKYIEPSPGPLREDYSKIELGNDPDPQLYNLKEDTGEQRNLARQYPARVKVLAEKLKDIKTGVFVRPGFNEPKVKIEYRLSKLKHNE